MIDKEIGAASNGLFSINHTDSRSGHRVLIINDKYIHSKYDPLKEHAEIIHSNRRLFLLFGGGLLYGAVNLFKNHRDSIFIIYEPVREVFLENINKIEKSQDNKDNHSAIIRELLSSESVLYTNRIDQNSIYDFISNRNRYLDYRLTVIENPAYRSTFHDRAVYLSDVVHRTINIITQSLMTEARFAPLWIKNFVKNISNDTIKFLSSRSRHLNCNKVACVVSAGPSLDRVVEEIIHNRQYLTIICVDTAYKSLLARQITPDIVVTLDAQYYSLDDFTNSLPDQTILVSDVISYPQVNRIAQDRTVFTITDNIIELLPYSLFNIGYTDIMKISTGGTVSDYAMNLAIQLGFTTIFLAGLDLSFPNYTTHANGSPYYSRAFSHSYYFYSIESQMIKMISDRSPTFVNGKNNRMVLSDFVLCNYRDYTASIPDQFDQVVIYNSTSDGIKINNIDEITLDKLIDKQYMSNLDYKTNDLSTGYNITDNLSDLINVIQDKESNRQICFDLYESANTLQSFFNNIQTKNIDDLELHELSNFVDSLLRRYKILNSFTIMTTMILSKKGIERESGVLWYRHFLNKLIQSIYYIIRVMQKSD